MPAPFVTEIVEGWTGRLSWQLTEDGDNLNGTGLTLSAVDVVGSDGQPVTTTSDFGWITQSSGTVYYDADADDLLARLSPYRIRFQVTDGSGKVVWFPNGAAEEIRVRGRYA